MHRGTECGFRGRKARIGDAILHLSTFYFNDSADFWYSLSQTWMSGSGIKWRILVVSVLSDQSDSSACKYRSTFYKLFQVVAFLKKNTDLKSYKIRLKKEKQIFNEHKESHSFQSCFKLTKCSLLSWTPYKSFKYVGNKGHQIKYASRVLLLLNQVCFTWH